jgi:spore germination protein PE
MNGEIRTAVIGFVYVVSAASASAVQFGDRGETAGRLWGLAVQRAEDHLTAGSVYFESYDLFSRPYPVLSDEAFDSGNAVTVKRDNPCQRISVGCIRVIAAGSASSIQAGNNMRLLGDSRIKHIRQYPKKAAFHALGSVSQQLDPP